MTNAQTLSLQLGGRWYGHYGAAPCPVCQPERRKSQNALTISNGVSCLLAHCKKTHCNFREIAVAAGIVHGTLKAPSAADIEQRKAQTRAHAARRSLQAQLLWSEAAPATGTLAEKYLRQRGITCDLPDTLRFQPNCWHPTAKRLPAMLALIEGGEGFAIHRTYLQHDGLAKSQVTPTKAMLGAVSGGSVRLTATQGPLIVAEGIETALSLSCGLIDGPVTVWAALSTSGMRGLRLPKTKSELTIASDGDAEGRKAAHTLAVKAAALGWKVSSLNAPEGQDWNDVLNEKGVVT